MGTVSSLFAYWEKTTTCTNYAYSTRVKATGNEKLNDWETKIINLTKSFSIEISSYCSASITNITTKPIKIKAK